MADYTGGSSIGATSSIAGLVWSAKCTSNGTATTAICSALAGFGNDYFNNKYYIQIIYNASGAGASPEPKVRKITDYAAASGTFTFGTVTDATAIGDKILIIHESLAALGRDGADSDYSSNNVVADKKGDIQERLEAAQVDLTAILAAAGAGTNLRTEKSASGPVEANAFIDFDIAIFDVDLGAVLAVDIDITAISVSLARSRAGVDFSTVGITQPVFAKATGRVYCSFQFANAEWGEGDLYKLAVTGIEATVDASVVFIPAAVWSNAILAPSAGGAGTLTEVETTSLNVGDGTNTSLSRAGLLQRYIADSVSTGIKQLTQAPASASATVITDANITETFNFKGALVLVLSGTNAGSSRPVVVSAVGSVTVYPPFDANVLAGETAILISAWRPNVWNQQVSVSISGNAVPGVLTLLSLATAGYSYMLNNLRVKCVDPGADTVTIKLYELIAGLGSTLVDSFVIDTSNYTTYYSLMDMFGIANVAGESIIVTATASANSYAITGRYQYALARTS